MMNIRMMTPSDTDAVAEIHHQAFPTDTDSQSKSKTWIQSKYKGWPINRYFVAHSEQEVVGYIMWVEMGGFRQSAVLELEQIAVRASFRGKGIGSQLVDESLATMCNFIVEEKRQLKLVQITTAKTNDAQKLYKKTMGAEICCTKPDFYEDDEVVMIARIEMIDQAQQKRGLPQLPKL